MRVEGPRYGIPPEATPKESLPRFVREASQVCQLSSAEVAAQYLMENIYTPFGEFDQEEMWVLLVDNDNFVTHEVMVYRGTVNTIGIRTVELLKEAVRQNSVGMVLSHCHLVSDPKPSREDIMMTEQVVRAGDILEVEVIDHIIVGKDRWVSMKEKGLMFE